MREGEKEGERGVEIERREQIIEERKKGRKEERMQLEEIE